MASRKIGSPKHGSDARSSINNDVVAARVSMHDHETKLPLTSDDSKAFMLKVSMPPHGSVMSIVDGLDVQHAGLDVASDLNGRHLHNAGIPKGGNGPSPQSARVSSLPFASLAKDGLSSSNLPIAKSGVTFKSCNDNHIDARMIDSIYKPLDVTAKAPLDVTASSPKLDSPSSSIHSWADHVDNEPKDGNLLDKLDLASTAVHVVPHSSSDGSEKVQGTWASIVKGDASSMQLTYIKPTSLSSEGKVRIKLPSSVVHKGVSNWKNTLVGFFLDKLPFSLVQNSAYKHWGSKGLVEVISNGNGFFFFKFSDLESLNVALDGGPWYFGGRPIFLQLWKPCMNLSKAGCQRVPIWVHFHNAPLEYWTDEGLSYIASIVGKPLHADKMTSALKRLSYARICVEIGIDDSLPSTFDIEMEDGSVVEVQIEYNWVPKKCLLCQEFGHLSKNCKKTSHQEWAPKVPQQAAPNAQPAGDWKQVKRHGKDIVVDSTPPPIDQPHKDSHTNVICSTSNAFEILPVDEDAVDEKKAFDNAPPASNDLILEVSQDVVSSPIPDGQNLHSHVTIRNSTPLERSVLDLDCSSSPLSESCAVPINNPLLLKLNMIDELDKKHKKTLKRRESRKKKEGSTSTPRTHSS